MLDRGTEAWQDAREADARLSEQSGHRWSEWWLAELSSLDGDHEDATRRLRIVCDWLDETQQLPFLQSYLSRLGHSLCMLGRFEEAEQVADRARSLDEELGSPVPDFCWRQVLARVHAQRGEHEEGERLAREAVAMSEQTDALDEQCLVLWDLAEVLAAAGRTGEAVSAFEQALERSRTKKNLARAAQIRRRLKTIQDEPSTNEPTNAA
jgi:tetratricopeptide (TPR) repeat protein